MHTEVAQLLAQITRNSERAVVFVARTAAVGKDPLNEQRDIFVLLRSFEKRLARQHEAL